MMRSGAPVRRSAVQPWVAVVVLMSSAVAPAQLVMMEPTPELERLAPFLGTWSFDHGEPPGPMEPTSARKVASWAPGDTWMAWEVQLNFANDQVIHGRRHITWDKAKEEYRSVWIDSQSALIIQSRGSWKDESTFVLLDGPFTWEDGRSYGFRVTYQVLSADEIHETMEMSVDGGEYFVRQEVSWHRSE